jgi:hypothetical protein
VDEGLDDGDQIFGFHAEYEYTVRGVPHVGHRVAFAPVESNALIYQERSKTGRAVPVYYAPNNPADAALARDFNADWPALMFGVLPFAPVAAIEIYCCVRQMRRDIALWGQQHRGAGAS